MYGPEKIRTQCFRVVMKIFFWYDEDECLCSPIKIFTVLFDFTLLVASDAIPTWMWFKIKHTKYNGQAHRQKAQNQTKAHKW